MSEKNYRATIVRDNGLEEDWGFFALGVNDGGVLVFRCNEATPRGDFDHYLAAGTWREVRDVVEEE